jgi:hypothetical protein
MVSYPSIDSTAAEAGTDDVSANANDVPSLLNVIVNSHHLDCTPQIDIDSSLSCKLECVETNIDSVSLDCKFKSNDVDRLELSSSAAVNGNTNYAGDNATDNTATCNETSVNDNDETGISNSLDKWSVGVVAIDVNRPASDKSISKKASDTAVEPTASVETTASSDTVPARVSDSIASNDGPGTDSSDMTLFMEVTCEPCEPQLNAQSASTSCPGVVLPSSVYSGQTKSSSEKPKSVFSSQIRPMASVLINTGFGLALQTSCRAKWQKLLKMKKRQRKTETEAADRELEKELDKLTKKLMRFNCSGVRCNGCRFRCDSKNILELHKEFGHGQYRLQFHCAFCQFSTQRDSEYVFHIKAKHNRVGRVQPRKMLECPLCPWETCSSVTFNKHVAACKKLYTPKRNLEPADTDGDIPIKKPKEQLVTAKLLSSVGHKMAPLSIIAASKSVLPSSLGTAPTVINAPKLVGPVLNTPRTDVIQATRLPRVQVSQPLVPKPVFIGNSTTPSRLVLIGGDLWYNLAPTASDKSYTAVPVSASLSSVLPPPKPALPATASLTKNFTFSLNQLSHSPVGNVTPQTLNPTLSIVNAAVAQSTTSNAQGKLQQPISTSTPIIIAPTNLTVNRRNSSSGCANNDEVCEICDKSIGDRQTLRTHFRLDHKISVDSQMIEQHVPVLGCSKCVKRFWTYEGLLKHLKDQHDTELDVSALPSLHPQPSSQFTTAAANLQQTRQQKQKSAVTYPTYTCSICGEKRVRFVVSHLAAKHAITVLDILAMKQCPCCGLNCISAEAVYSHIEAKHPEMVIDPAFKMCQLTCQFCAAKFTTASSLEAHCKAQHQLTCTYCCERLPGAQFLRRHMASKHKDAKQRCPVCNEKFPFGSAFIRHVKSAHLRKCNVRMDRLLPEDLKAKNYKHSDGFNFSQGQDKVKLATGRNNDTVITIEID